MIDKSLLKSDELEFISVRGAREHNLKNVSLDIPRDKLVVISGLSGSGKSTLAFDTLYAEGQRRYVECLSQYAKQFIGVMKKPEVDVVEGLSPAISIEQKSISHSARSTVGTITEVYDYLRLLYSKVGIQYCTKCNIPVVKKSNELIKDEILKKYNGQKVEILAPIIRGRKGDYRDLFETFLKQGFTRVRINGQTVHLLEVSGGRRNKPQDIDLVVDRVTIDEKQYVRLSESIDIAIARGEGMAIVACNGSDELFSTLNSCPECGKSYNTLSPNMFSFNSPYGACPRCQGIGEIEDIDPEKLVPDKSLSIKKGALLVFNKNHDPNLFKLILDFCETNNISTKIPWSDIPEEQKHKILFIGDRNDEFEEEVLDMQQILMMQNAFKFKGVISVVRNLRRLAYKKSDIQMLESLVGNQTCSLCKGGRLKFDNLFVRVGDKNIQEVTSCTIPESKKFFEEYAVNMDERQKALTNIIVKEIISRLSFLENVGLSYLTMSRPVRTLSGGEAQRIRLASQIGSQLVGVMYVLDEPSIGLHQHDNNRLIDSLKNLRDLGNTVLVVEHDKAMIEESDFLIDLGPGAGVHGGEVVLAGYTSDLVKLSDDKLSNSLTAQYIKNIKRIEVPDTRRKPTDKFLVLNGANGNNLKNINLEIPLGTFVCITGMSGSGKSTLINDTLFPILANEYHGASEKALPYDNIEGLTNIDKVIEIDQSPIGRTPRSNPATYTGLFTIIRDFFTQLTESKVRGYKAGRFSFNVKGGRCEECEGGGMKKIEMNFLPDVFVTCDVCNGKRYNDETLQVLYKGKSIADVLDMTVEEANDFFTEIPKIKKKLTTLFEVGLGYIKLGQQAPTLSGGEAQRVKLATELSKVGTGKTLYLLDEPTTGLHFEDVRILLILLNKLVEKGNTVVVVEHNLDVVKTADWVIDLGPEGGEKGGEIIAAGSPEDIIKAARGYTYKYLAEEMNV